jgi:hypothetical protein
MRREQLACAFVLEIEDERVKLQGSTAKNKEIVDKPAPVPTPTNVDLVKVLQQSLSRTQLIKQKRSPTRSHGCSTGALVKQKRRSGRAGQLDLSANLISA